MTKQNSLPWLAVLAVGGTSACLVIVLAVLWIGGTIFFISDRTMLPAPTTEKIERPKDKVGCQAIGGKWERIGIALEDECNLPTTDGGQVCLDSRECQGLCVAEVSEDEFKQVRYARTPIATQGQCTHWQITVGCVPVVRSGQVSEILCLD